MYKILCKVKEWEVIMFLEIETKIWDTFVKLTWTWFIWFVWIKRFKIKGYMIIVSICRIQKMEILTSGIGCVWL